MNDTQPDPLANASREEVLSALFANLVMQQVNMALMFLGRMPHPETGEAVLDLESAKFFIEQLEMLEAKTRGNLDKREEGLLKQSLTQLRMAFVEAGNHPMAHAGTPLNPEPAAAPAAVSAPAPITEKAPEPSIATPPVEEESRKRFSKKY